MKTCTKCGVEKPEAEFKRRGGGKYASVCKACSANVQRQYYTANAVRIQARRSARFLAKRLRDKGFTVEITFEGEQL